MAAPKILDLTSDQDIKNKPKNKRRKVFSFSSQNLN
jgi:hypothetical protein|tara:strand:+ start:600 stop:707 length:108 start_codon:yes stop_codon:yes gene_type:complete